MTKKKDVGLKVNIVIEAIDKVTGKVKDRRDIHNIVVNNGLSRIANLINDDTANAFEYIEIGIGTTSATINDTELENEVARELATLSEDPANSAKWVKLFTFASGESYAITETGIFDGVSGGVMMNRSVFAALNVDSDTDLSMTITLAVANA